jgi:hypothetical protein
LAGAGPLSADGVSGRLAKSATRWDTSIESLGYVNRAGAVMGKCAAVTATTSSESR